MEGHATRVLGALVEGGHCEAPHTTDANDSLGLGTE